jgi:hypothetical protein
MRRFKPGTTSNTVVGLAAVLAILSLVPCVSAQKYVFNNGARSAPDRRSTWIGKGPAESHQRGKNSGGAACGLTAP